MLDNFHILEKHYGFNDMRTIVDTPKKEGFHRDPLETGAVSPFWALCTEICPTGPCTSDGQVVVTLSALTATGSTDQEEVLLKSEIFFEVLAHMEESVTVFLMTFQESN